MKRKVAFKTLGCRLNQFETDSLVTDFSTAGYEIVDFSDKADIYIVNTCTVTNQGDRKSKYAISQAIRSSQNPLLVITGCIVSNQQANPLEYNTPTYFVDNTRKSAIISLVDAHFRGEIIQPEILPQNVFNYSLVQTGFHTRSALKIQDGCDNFCTYCIVPAVRGKAISRPVEEILDNAGKLLDLGNREIVLTGVNISRYEYGNIHFADLLEKILDIPGDFRVRISSIEPEGFNEKLFNLFENPKLCPHLHLCLQSGSDSVLLRMRRFYSVSQFLHIVNNLKLRYNSFNFTTDIIVGFPGETDQEFKETLQLIEEIGFSHIHTFKYSRRSGTRADRMPEQISEQVKSERSLLIRQLADKMKLQQRESFMGKMQNLLVERTHSRGGARGYGEHYIPILLKNNDLQKNAFYKVMITDVLDDKEKTVLATLPD
jgi:threonylcarbamoyladenosine tRNA methylthiotransferase MtaB